MWLPWTQTHAIKCVSAYASMLTVFTILLISLCVFFFYFHHHHHHLPHVVFHLCWRLYVSGWVCVCGFLLTLRALMRLQNSCILKPSIQLDLLNLINQFSRLILYSICSNECYAVWHSFWRLHYFSLLQSLTCHFYFRSSIQWMNCHEFSSCTYSTSNLQTIAQCA